MDMGLSLSKRNRLIQEILLLEELNKIYSNGAQLTLLIVISFKVPIEKKIHN